MRSLYITLEILPPPHLALKDEESLATCAAEPVMRKRSNMESARRTTESDLVFLRMGRCVVS